MTMKISEKYLTGKKVAVALSGGKDSMALIHYLLNNFERMNVKLCAVNVEHGIRGEESLRDSLFVKDYCEKNGIELFSYSVNVPKYAVQKGKGEEQSARELRYLCFDELLKDKKAEVIATAHHKRDNAETVLFNLFRGSALSGLKGISEKNGAYVRPMIYTDKSEIDEYIAENTIPFVTDSTNFDNNYSRNYIRNVLLPQIENKFSGAENSICSFARIAAEDDEYIYEKAKKITQIFDEEVRIKFSNNYSVFSRAVIYGLKELGIKKDYSSDMAERLYKLQTAENGTTIDVKGEVKGVKDYDRICLYKRKKTKPICTPFAVGETIIGDTKIIVKEISREKFENSDYNGLAFDGNKLPCNCIFRYRNNGDVFRKYGGGTKKLKEYFIDCKIPERYRDGIIVVAEGKEVYIITEKEISDKIKVDNFTKLIYNISTCKISDK